MIIWELAEKAANSTLIKFSVSLEVAVISYDIFTKST